jgi:hypothetical protein
MDFVREIRDVKLTKGPIYVKEILVKRNPLTVGEVLYTVYKARRVKEIDLKELG